MSQQQAAKILRKVPAQAKPMLADAKALASKKGMTWSAMNKIDQSSIMKQAHTAKTSKKKVLRSTVAKALRKVPAQAKPMLDDAKALATKRGMSWDSMNKLDQSSIMKQAHTAATKKK